MASKIQIRRGTAAQWQSGNPVLAIGEPGAETDTGRFKIGDGVAAWSTLPYSNELGPVAVPQLPAGSTLTVVKSGPNWPARPTSRADIVVVWEGADPGPAVVSSGTGGMLTGVDYRVGRSSSTPAYWGTGTSYPTTPIVGDTITRSDLANAYMRYNGTAWRQAEITQVANASARNALTPPYGGFRVDQLDSGCTYVWQTTTPARWWKASGPRAQLTAIQDSAQIVCPPNVNTRTTLWPFTADSAGDLFVSASFELSWSANAAMYYAIVVTDNAGALVSTIPMNTFGMRFHNGNTLASSWVPVSLSGSIALPSAGTYKVCININNDPASGSNFFVWNASYIVSL